ncbi:copper homeostasis periplasmic binding protein CopC [Cobetia sp. L2A1]|uniref:copper homeostasis periplasmic binding protein CopC n=1 Tax=Cobetia sp. L2A1 TaxID=2686360 RepID=UPI0018EEF0CA|nr:copper homeostasis periplasmic binding protein CopC [Cobetia sp. L2A1]
MTLAKHWITSFVVGGMLFSSQVFAHAHIDTATPAEGAKVSSPKVISLTFTESLELPFSGIQMTDAKGQPVSMGDASLRNKDMTLTAPVTKSLTPGEYEIQWHVLSTDGHKTEGDYLFTITP